MKPKKEPNGLVMGHFVTAEVFWWKPWTWSSAAILYRTASYTHVDFLMPAGYVYPDHHPLAGKPIPAGSLVGSRSDFITPLDGGPTILPGVRVRPPSYEHWSAERVLSKVVPKAVEREVYTAVLSQLGKPYDAGGIVSFITGRYPRNFNWQDENKWFCDELFVWACVNGGAGPMPPLDPTRIDPGGAALWAGGAGFA